MKILIWILFVASFSSMLVGLFINTIYSEQFIGGGVLGLFIVVFPLFSYYRWKDKKASDYMLSKEKLEKMRGFNNRD